jgi:hypothetical protein
MLKKVKKSQKGPSWFEVGLAAALSVALGVVLGIAYLADKPVTKVTSIPKDPPSGAIFYIEGAKSLNMADVSEKRHSFVNGETIDVDEGELNGFLQSIWKGPASAPAPKPGDKGAPPPPPDQKLLEVGALNARIRDQKVQFGDTATINVLGMSVPVIVQATGVFVRGGSGFEFDPDTLLVGGCPMQRMLFLRGMIMRKLLFTETPPDDVAAAWSKLADVSVNGTKLHLRAQ